MNKNFSVEQRNSEYDISIVDDESIFIYKQISIPKDQTIEAYDVTPHMWFLSIVEMEGGSVTFFRDGEDIILESGAYGIYYPPYSISKMRVTNSSAKMGILVSKKAHTTTIPQEPVLFKLTKAFTSFTYDDIEELLISSRDRHINIGITTGATGIGKRIKSKIDKHYLTPMKLSEIAASIGISSNLLSMYFKESYGLTPSEYRKNLRVISSVEKLLRSNQSSETISTIANESGYNDLSRYYKQFKSVVGTSPRKVKI